MDRPAAPGELTGGGGGGSPRHAGVHFQVATAAHDPALRRLLRDNPMRGQISLSLEREPNYFAAAQLEGPEHRTIVAVENGRVICAGGVSARSRFVNGHPTRVGYLGGLRLDSAARGRTQILFRGYEMFHRLHESGGPPIYLTSIVAGNLPALRLLERGLRGMPTYRFLGEFVTLMIPRRASSIRSGKSIPQLSQASDQLLPSIAELLNRDHAQYQFAPAWSADDLRSPAVCPDLRPEDFYVAFAPDGASAACAALWDQRRLKQSIVRHYSPRLQLLRPLVNAAAALLARPRLPAVGRPISHAYVSHLAADPSRPELLRQLLRTLQSAAHARDIDYLILGFDARDPRLAHVRAAFRPREYLSRLYAVHWDDGAKLAAALDGRLLAPEVATL